MSFRLAFLQARMGSTRLPGKVLMQIHGKSLLFRAIERLRAARSLKGVVVLTTEREEDDAVAEEARRTGAACFRGPEQDVLARFCLAADHFRPDVIVRATADNPLIDIGSIDRIVKTLQTRALDYCMESNLPVGAATEAITFAALKKASLLAHMPHHREHVTIYVKEHPEDFRTEFPDAPARLRLPHVRVTVDTPADYLFVETLIQSIPENGAPVPLRAYLELLPSATFARIL